MINPLLNAEAYDKFLIGTTPSPGIVRTIDGWERKYDWDKKKGKGTAGASITFTSRPLLEGSITIEMWAAAQFNEWEDFLRICSYDTTKRPAQAVNIYYPTIAALGVKAVVVAAVTPIVHAGKGLYRSTFSFVEYAPPPKKPATSTPSGTGNGNGNGPRTGPRALEGDGPPPVQERQQNEIAGLLDEAGRV